MSKNPRVISAGPSKSVMFHGYILSCIIGVKWNLSPTGGMNNPKITQVARDYLSHAVGDNEWEKQKILSYIKDTSSVILRKQTKKAFPSLFNKVRRKALTIPEELKDKNPTFDIDKINNLKNRVNKIKMEMNHMSNETETIQNEVITQNDTETTNPTSSNNVESLTLENFMRITGRKFRVTKEQKQRINDGLLTREGALEEYKNSMTNNQ